jgi:sporulation protein YlmC with PRC-barrel domain
MKDNEKNSNFQEQEVLVEWKKVKDIFDNLILEEREVSEWKLEEDIFDNLILEEREVLEWK